jgi:hypothetical protein
LGSADLGSITGIKYYLTLLVMVQMSMRHRFPLLTQLKFVVNNCATS